MPLDINCKLFERSSCVAGVDFHSTKPWLLVCLFNGTIKLYDLESGTAIRTFEVADHRVRRGKFIPRNDWVVAGSDDGKLHVFDCNSDEKVTDFVAHSTAFYCVTVHPTAPIVLTGSSDRTIKAWNWEKKWRNIRTYQGHSATVLNITFNPKDFDIFVSASIDSTVKIWSITSPFAISTINAHTDGLQYVEFYSSADKLYLVTASVDKTIKVWDYLSKNCVRTLRGHTKKVTFAVFHPNLPIIISGSEDGTVKIWNSTTYKVEHTLNCELGGAWRVALHNDTNEVAVGFNEGVITLEIDHDEPNVSDKTVDTMNKLSMDQPGNSHVDETIDKMTNLSIDHSGGPRVNKMVDTMSSVSIKTFGVDQAQDEIECARQWGDNIKDGDKLHGHDVELYEQCATLAMEVMATKPTDKFVSELTHDKAQDMADFLSKMVKDEDNFGRRKRKYILRLLSKLAKSAAVFPQYLELEGVQCNLTTPVTVGGYGFIYKGEHEGSTICVKAVHVDSEGIDRKKMRAQAGELIIWAHLKHPNILPFSGIYLSKEDTPRVCIVSPWMNNGDLFQYLRRFPDVPRKPLVFDIISGLQYLHEFDIVHADLKAKNVLVSKTGRAMLADFGISRLSMTQTTTTTNVGSGTACWMAPELLLNGKPASCESDVWAFACTCYEIITGTTPFSQYRNVPLLIHAFMKGNIVPVKPAPGIGWDEDIWSVAMRCWQPDPENRPTAHEILDVISSDTKLEKTGAEPNYNRILSILDKIRQSY